MTVELARLRDLTKQEWVKNWVNGEALALSRKDKDDLSNMMEAQGEDIDKLRK